MTLSRNVTLIHCDNSKHLAPRGDVVKELKITASSQEVEVPRHEEEEHVSLVVFFGVRLGGALLGQGHLSTMRVHRRLVDFLPVLRMHFLIFHMDFPLAVNRIFSVRVINSPHF